MCRPWGIRLKRDTALCVIGKLILAAMYLWRVGIDCRSYAAAPTQVSTDVTPLAPAAKKTAWKKAGGGGAETLP
jgi:hypothetical protein